MHAPADQGYFKRSLSFPVPCISSGLHFIMHCDTGPCNLVSRTGLLGLCWAPSTKPYLAQLCGTWQVLTSSFFLPLVLLCPFILLPNHPVQEGQWGDQRERVTHPETLLVPFVLTWPVLGCLAPPRTSFHVKGHKQKPVIILPLSQGRAVLSLKVLLGLHRVRLSGISFLPDWTMRAPESLL
jgi:hypothetical protein